MTIVWVVGFVITILIYLAGPEHFFYWLFDLVDRARFAVEEAVENLSQASFNLMRATAIGLFVVFVALGVLVLRGGGRARAALVLVSGLFLLLVWRHGGYVANARWFAALVLVAVGAAVMTQRLRGPR